MTFNLSLMMPYQTQVLDCQFQMRIVWSSEALRIHGYSYREENCVVVGFFLNEIFKHFAQITLLLVIVIP